MTAPPTFTLWHLARWGAGNRDTGQPPTPPKTACFYSTLICSTVSTVSGKKRVREDNDWRRTRELGGKYFQMPLNVTKWWYFIIIVRFLRFLTVAQAVCGLAVAFAFCIQTDRLTDPTDSTHHYIVSHGNGTRVHRTVEIDCSEYSPWLQSGDDVCVPSWFTSDILWFTYCVREALSTLTLPFMEGSLPWFSTSGVINK